MRTYVKLLKLGVFTLNDAVAVHGGSKNSAVFAVRFLLNNKLVESVKKNLYVCNDIENKLPVADKFKIGSSIAKDAYISHYSALEFHGFVYDYEDQWDFEDEDQEDGNQIDLDFYDGDRTDFQDGEHQNGDQNNTLKSTIYVSSSSKVKPFNYKGISYKPVALKHNEGVMTYNKRLGTRVTNIERTVLDCLKDIDKAGGIEEFLACLCSISFLDSDKLIEYLEMYNIQFLYQKAGYILEKFKFKLPPSFYELCHERMSKSSRYLTNKCKGSMLYIADWKLLVSKDLIFYMDHGCDLC